MQTPQDPFKRESLRHCWLGQCRVPLVSKVELGSCARCVGLSVCASFQDRLCKLAPLGLLGALGNFRAYRAPGLGLTG